MDCTATAVWDERYLAYDFGDHPLNPVRLDLTVRLARALGVFERLEVVAPEAADETQLLTVHDAAYLQAVRMASNDPSFTGYGLGTSDDPVFAGMYDASALIAGGSAIAATRLWDGHTDHAVNIAGGLHHAMRGYASGFCVFNDAVLGIRTLLAAGATKVAYIDIDVHHGDGVQAAFYDDPQVLTVSLHQDPRTLFPGTGMPSELGTGAAEGTSINVALPPGTDDDGWLRAFRAVVPGAVRAFAPDVLVTQCGCDTHHEDPLANLELSVDGQRQAIAELHQLAHEVAGGKWLAFGGGGYGLVRCVPRTWTHLLAEATGMKVDPRTEIPDEWTEYVRGRGARGELPRHMGEGRTPAPTPWQPGGETWLDGAIGATRRAAFPLLGLDPDDPVTEPADVPQPDPTAPAHWEADVVVADGGTVHLRPIRPDDADAIVAFHGGLSSRTRYLRYFSAYPRIPDRDLQRFTQVDHHNRVAFVALLGSEIIAVGRYERTEGTDDAEVAFVVADVHQGRGIGSVLLEHLAAAGRERGVRQFHAIVLAENTNMVRVFREAGYETARHLEYGEITLEFAIDETAVTEGVMREREQRAEARSIKRLLYPRTVAVVGASNDETKIGHAVFTNLLRMNFDGRLFPINPDAPHVRGVPAYRSVLDVPGEIDLVVVAVPAAAVSEVVEQCATRGVRGLVVLSGGFGERGDDDERTAGRAAQRMLVNEARGNGMRVVGPNCLGVINTDVTVRLNASLAPLPPLPGRAGFFAQSGALGVAILGEAARRGIGVSTFVSAGSRADVSGNDLLQYWESDEHTDVVLMYLESFGNPRKFARLARRLGRTKPIVAVNSGAGTAGLATTSVDLSVETARALFERSGVIRVDTVGDLFDVALLLTSQPLPAGARVAVVGNSTALSLLVRNACAAEGLSLDRIVDVGVDAGPKAFGDALELALDDDAIDSVVAVFVPPLLPVAGDEVAGALRAAASSARKPVVSTYLGFEGVPGEPSGEGVSSPPPGSVPSYSSPERAVRALARAVRYADWRARPLSTVPDLERVDTDAARSVVEGALSSSPDGRELTPDEAGRLLGTVDLRVSYEVPPESVEVVFAVREDQSFGALASFGIAGVAIELLGDRAYAPVPLTSADAEELIREPRAAPLLTGYNGSSPMDLLALADVVLRLSALADALPELADCTVHALAAPIGAHVTAVTARVRPATTRADTGPRRLRGL